MRPFLLSLLLAPALVLAVADPAVGQGGLNPYGWTLSSSDSDPYENAGPLPVGAPFTLYLWLACSTEGWSFAEMRIESRIPPLLMLGIVPRPGIVIVGDTIFPDVRLAVGGCPTGPMLVAELLCILFAPGHGEICIVPSSAGNRFTVDCSVPAEEFPFRAIGFGSDGPPSGTCADGDPWLLCSSEFAYGACCLPDGRCILESEIQCALRNGRFQGHYSSCDTASCPPTGVGSPEAESWGRAKSHYR